MPYVASFSSIIYYYRNHSCHNYIKTNCSRKCPEKCLCCHSGFYLEAFITTIKSSNLIYFMTCSLNSFSEIGNALWVFTTGITVSARSLLRKVYAIAQSFEHRHRWKDSDERCHWNGRQQGRHSLFLVAFICRHLLGISKLFMTLYEFSVSFTVLMSACCLCLH